MTLAGCSSGNHTHSPDKSPSTASTTHVSATPAPGSQALAKQALLNAYRRYWQEKTLAYSRATMAGTQLATYAKGDALGLAQSDLKNLQTVGQVTEGEVRNHPQVASLDLRRKVPLAEISDCVDVSAWKIVNAKTRSAGGA